jgi:hypothetical protein
MAYNFIGLVNEVNRRLNEVELTTENFDTAVGFYSAAKDSVNASLRFINQSAYEWPFNHVEAEDALSAGDVRYALPSDLKTLDLDTFRIKRNDTLGNATKKLKILSYEDYLDKFVDSEYSNDTSIRSMPEYVFRTPNQQYGIYPPPNLEYTVVYEYYRLPVDLLKHSDVPSLPEQFRSEIIDGAMHYAYFFRGNTQDATLHFDKFEAGIKNMRSIYINRYEYLRDTRVNRSRY